MNRKILWIEDDYYAVKGLVRPLELLGFDIDVATSAKEGRAKILKDPNYTLVIVDIILPLSDDGEDNLEIVIWGEEPYVGVALVRWMLSMNLQIPIIVLSIVADAEDRFGLAGHDLLFFLTKKGLLPTKVKEETLRILEQSSFSHA